MRRLILPLFFGIVGTAVLVSLGVWQLQRLAWKEAVLAEIDAKIAAEPVALPDTLDPAYDRFLAVQISGTFIAGEELHVLASTRDVGAVYRVVSAFKTEAGRRVMVDRGWIPTTAKNNLRESGAAVVSGNLHWPDEVDNFTPQNDLDENIWFARDVETMAQALNAEPVLVIARQTSENPPQVMPLPVDSAGIPNDHLQYVLTWFGLAIVWVAMTLYYLRRMRKTKKA